jgi:hypothetical protein
MKQITDDEILTITGILNAIKARGDFPVIPLPVTPTITVTLPSAGAIWRRGTTQTIGWTSTGLTGMVRITLLKAGVEVGTITQSTPNTGLCLWTLDPAANLKTGTDFKIVVAAGTVKGESSVFTIPFPTQNPLSYQKCMVQERTIPVTR